MHALVGALDPGEKKQRHSGIRFDPVRKRVIYGLVPSDFESAAPRALHEQVRWRDHEEEIDDLAEARQQVAACDVGVRREAVETEAVDQQMRHVPPLRFVLIELLIDDAKLVSGERAGVLVGRTQHPVIEQLFAPYVSTDQRNTLAPERVRSARLR